MIITISTTKKIELTEGLIMMLEPQDQNTVGNSFIFQVEDEDEF